MATTAALPSAADLAQLARYDTPTVCNVIELFDIRPRHLGYMDHRIRAVYPKLPPMVGYAVTAQFSAAAPPRAGVSYASLAEQVRVFADLPGPAVVVIEDPDQPTVAATYGEVMTTVYQSFGAAGLITSGAGRDLDQVEALRFPCFVNSINPAHAWCHFETMHQPVRVGGLRVCPGDLLHGDGNGVTGIPLEIAADVARLCPEFAAAEKIIFEAMKAQPRPTTADLEAAMAQARERFAELRRRVSRKPVA